MSFNHPWRMGGKLSALKKEAENRKRRERYAADKADPVYHAATNETEARKYREKYQNDPVFREKRKKASREYQRAKRTK